MIRFSTFVEQVTDHNAALGKKLKIHTNEINNLVTKIENDATKHKLKEVIPIINSMHEILNYDKALNDIGKLETHLGTNKLLKDLKQHIISAGQLHKELRA